ncbi:hypothetical protein [Bradyrhizobium sp. RDM4]|uniref:hypothetical protein n=1 Tax=Bradyrhizobium sp. RDM4 TaxID=3378765 RepID=UPI0038FC6463
MRQQIELHIKANKNRSGADRLTGAGAHDHPSIAGLAQHLSAVLLSLPSSREVERSKREARCRWMTLERSRDSSLRAAQATCFSTRP